MSPEADYFIWRPVIEGKAGLEELDTFWDLDDLAEYHELKDIQELIKEQERDNANN